MESAFRNSKIMMIKVIKIFSYTIFHVNTGKALITAAVMAKSIADM